VATPDNLVTPVARYRLENRQGVAQRQEPIRRSECMAAKPGKKDAVDSARRRCPNYPGKGEQGNRPAGTGGKNQDHRRRKQGVLDH
jgi:hypothetical protein